MGIRKPNNAGLVTTTAGGPDLLHTLPIMTVQSVIFPARPYIIRKIMWSNNTGVDTIIAIGTRSATPANVQILPAITALTGFDGELTEAELPAVVWESFTAQQPAATRFDGNCYAVCAVAGLLILLEVEELG